MSAWDRNHLDKFLGCEGNHFTAKLIRLIADSDATNRENLRKGFPEEVDEVERHLRRGKPLVQVFGYLSDDG